MKKISLFILLGLAMPLAAETVSAVSYNPSRMGDYDYLRVSRKATLRGGLQVPYNGTDNTTGVFTVNSSGTNPITFSFTDNNNEDSAQRRYYTALKLTGGSNTTVSFPTAVVYEDPGSGQLAATDQLDWSSYSAATSSTPDNHYTLHDVNLSNDNNGGGSLTVQNDSYIGKLQNSADTMLYVANKTLVKNLAITGNGGSSVSFNGADNGSNSSSTTAFILAGNNIPYPSGSGNVYNHPDHKTLNIGLSGCKLDWAARKVSGHNNQTVYVLALDGCAEADSAQPPAPTCSDASYKASHKSECCPAAPKTDTTCWTPQNIWVDTNWHYDYGASGCDHHIIDHYYESNGGCPASVQNDLDMTTFCGPEPYPAPCDYRETPACSTQGATCKIGVRCWNGISPCYTITFTCIASGEYTHNGW